MTDTARSVNDTAAARLTAALEAAVTPAGPGTPGGSDRGTGNGTDNGTGSNTDRAAVWRLAELVAADWSKRPLTPEDGYTDADLDAAEARLGHPLPAALREALKLFGRRDDLLRNQDPLATPQDLDTYEGALIYREENQGVCAWGVLLEDLDQDDPPTYLRPDLADKSEEEWLPWTDKLSLALVEALITETIIGDDSGDGGDSGEEDLTAAWQPSGEAPEETGLTALPRIQPDWYKTAWYVGDDVLAHVADGAWISVRGRTREALAAYTGEDEAYPT